MRFDHTDWLIHFVRDRKPDQDFPGDDEEEMLYFAGGELGCDADAFSVLRTIIRLGGLIPGYSFRNGRTTIYGGEPAVCATEMPIYSFSRYVRDRNDTEAVSAYGIAFLKSEFYAAGGRPVIYGLSTDAVKYISNKSSIRIFEESTLPQQEQYRYVAYSPAGNKWIDWSHEREWRWCARNEEHKISAKNGYDIYDRVPGLPLFEGAQKRGGFTKIGIIVWSEEEAYEIQQELTGFYLAESNDYGTPFCRKLLRNSFIIVLDEVIKAVEVEKRLKSQTIEGIDAVHLLKTIILCEDTEAHRADILRTIEEAKRAGEKAAAEYIMRFPTEWGMCGFANIVSYDVTNPVVQQLLKMEVGSGPFDGKVVIYLHGDWPRRQSIDYNEHIAEAMCSVFKDRLGGIFSCESRLD